MVEKIHCPAPSRENHAHNEDPGFNEDPNIFIELIDGVYCHASLDGSEVAIMADYPGLLPSSDVSTHKTSSQKEPSPWASPTALTRAQKGRCLARHLASRAASKKIAPMQGEPSKRK